MPNVVNEAAKSVDGISLVYVKEMSAYVTDVTDNKVVSYGVNAKGSYVKKDNA